MVMSASAREALAKDLEQVASYCRGLEGLEQEVGRTKSIPALDANISGFSASYASYGETFPSSENGIVNSENLVSQARRAKVKYPNGSSTPWNDCWVPFFEVFGSGEYYQEDFHQRPLSYEDEPHFNQATIAASNLAIRLQVTSLQKAEKPVEKKVSVRVTDVVSGAFITAITCLVAYLVLCVVGVVLSFITFMTPLPDLTFKFGDPGATALFVLTGMAGVLAIAVLVSMHRSKVRDARQTYAAALSEYEDKMRTLEDLPKLLTMEENEQELLAIVKEALKGASSQMEAARKEHCDALASWVAGTRDGINQIADRIGLMPAQYEVADELAAIIRNGYAESVTDALVFQRNEQWRQSQEALSVQQLRASEQARSEAARAANNAASAAQNAANAASHAASAETWSKVAAIEGAYTAYKVRNL